MIESLGGNPYLFRFEFKFMIISMFMDAPPELTLPSFVLLTYFHFVKKIQILCIALISSLFHSGGGKTDHATVLGLGFPPV